MVTYKAKSYDPRKQYKRYVRCDGGGNFYFCEVEDGRDVAQGVAYEREISPAVIDAAKQASGQFPSYVDWPY